MAVQDPPRLLHLIAPVQVSWSLIDPWQLIPLSRCRILLYLLSLPHHTVSQVLLSTPNSFKSTLYYLLHISLNKPLYSKKAD